MEADSKPGFRLSPATRWFVTLGILLLVGLWLDLPAIIDELRRFSLVVIIPVALLTIFQVVVSAWRWQYTASCLDLSLPMLVAVREYYLATFLNQVLPGGVLGDVNRAWRHSQDSRSRLASVHAVVIERLSGQCALGLVTGALGLWLMSGVLSVPATEDAASWYGGLGVLAIVLIATVAILRIRRRLVGYLAYLRKDLRRGLLRWPVFPVQLISSLLVVSAYLGVFMLLALGAGYLTDLQMAGKVLALSSLLLMAMILPFTVAGWGVREGAAALLWPLVGLPAEQGVALSVGYGLVVLVSSLPGALFVVSLPASAR